MPKTSQLELNFQRKRILPFLLDRPMTKDTLAITERLLKSLLKAKSSSRRKEYRHRLDKILVCLAVANEDLVEQKQVNKQLQKKYDYLQERHSKMFNKNLNSI